MLLTANACETKIMNSGSAQVSYLLTHLNLQVGQVKDISQIKLAQGVHLDCVRVKMGLNLALLFYSLNDL